MIYFILIQRIKYNTIVICTTSFTNLDATPRQIWEEINGARNIHDGRETKQEIKLLGINFLLREKDLEGGLRHEDDLVLLKETSSCVHVHTVCDTVDQVHDALFDLVRRFGFVDRFLEHNAECLFPRENKLTSL